MMHSQERRYEMGNTLRYEGFRNVLLSQMRKRLSGKLGINTDFQKRNGKE